MPQFINLTIRKFINWVHGLWWKPRALSVLGGHHWEFSRVWNQSLLRPERPIVPRDHVWASEIGGAMIDRYLKMTGVKPSNAPNDRSLRKFAAGDLWEWVCALVLRRAGILIETQTRLSYQYDGLLRVSGKLDFLAGGQPDWKRARHEIAFVGLPEILHVASLAIIKHLEATYGNDPLKIIIIDIKSCSSFMYDRYEKTGQASPNHRAQIFHYLKSSGRDEGHVVYICKDDCRILEREVLNPSFVETEYINDLTEITGYYLARERPPLEKEILFDVEMDRFEKNWKIEYSNYLTMLYGYKTPMEYRDQVGKVVAAYNRTFKRCVKGSKMTLNNLQTIKQAKDRFPNWDDLVDRARAKEAA